MGLRSLGQPRPGTTPPCTVQPQCVVEAWGKAQGPRLSLVGASRSARSLATEPSSRRLSQGNELLRCPVMMTAGSSGSSSSAFRRTVILSTLGILRSVMRSGSAARWLVVDDQDLLALGGAWRVHPKRSGSLSVCPCRVREGLRLSRKTRKTNLGSYNSPCDPS
jgi:hypothetical protein